MEKDIWTNITYSFNWSDENPTRRLTEEDKQVLRTRLPFPCSAFGSVRFTPHRAIINTSLPPQLSKIYQAKYEEQLTTLLQELGILK